MLTAPVQYLAHLCPGKSHDFVSSEHHINSLQQFFSLTASILFYHCSSMAAACYDFLAEIYLQNCELLSQLCIEDYYSCNMSALASHFITDLKLLITFTHFWNCMLGSLFSLLFYMGQWCTEVCKKKHLFINQS